MDVVGSDPAIDAAAKAVNAEVLIARASFFAVYGRPNGNPHWPQWYAFDQWQKKARDAACEKHGLPKDFGQAPVAYVDGGPWQEFAG